jgi:hypothetical protein
VALAGLASGQEPVTPKAPDAPAAPAISTTGSGEVQLKLERFGVGSLCRPGEWVGVKVQFLDAAPKPREIMVRLAGVDPDGDTPLYQREFTSNPGTWQSAWLYLRLPFWYTSDRPVMVTVHEALEDVGSGSSTEVSATGFVAGRLLGTAEVSPAAPQSVVEPSVGLMAIVGNSGYALGRYSARMAGEPWSPKGHEILEIAPRLAPEDLPDRWQGLTQFDVVVWGSGDPGELRGDRAKALREWVERGGHLVVVLPPVGETWTNRISNELFDLLPAVAIVRKESVDLEPYRPLLTRKRPADAPMPKNAVVHELRPLGEASAAEASPILNGPDGACVVARRLVGSGAVTLVGIDASQRSLIDFDLLDADVFWHRVLGRRGALLGTAELTEEQNRLQGAGATMSSRTRMPFDADIGREIAKTGRSATGVLMGVALFVLYWAVAGPLGYAVLKRKGIVRHAWVAYLGAAGVFTAIAWGGATALRPGKTEASHLTFLDHVYGQPIQRSRTWASVLIPRYGTARLSVGDPGIGEDAGKRSTNLVAAFDPPWAQERGVAMFPDTRGYVIDARRPDSIVVPTRSTVKQIQADWAGGPRWEMPHPVAPAGTAAPEKGAAITIGAGRQLSGILVHKLPGPLENVILMVNYGQRPVSVGSSGETLSALVNAYKISSWKPGEPLDLETVIKGPGNADEYLQAIADSGSSLDDVTNKLSVDVGNLAERLNAIAFFPQIAPPRFTSAGMFQGNYRGPSLPQRAATHGWDLGRWFTQPCVIIVGQLGASGAGAECPTPLYLDGEPIRARGRTVVRWVYPLPAMPPRYPESEKPAAAPDAKGGS